MRHLQAMLLVIALVAISTSMLIAQDSGDAAEADASADTPTTQPANTDKAGSDEVMDDMMKRLKERPSRGMEATDEEGKTVKPTVRSKVPVLDPRIVGVAPDMPQPKLRREGEFVVSRRGRIARTRGGRDVMFMFDSVNKDKPEPPMILVPCEILETMENEVERQGDKISFIVSGQILTYRGANYLLPTMMKVDWNRGNIGK